MDGTYRKRTGCRFMGVLVLNHDCGKGCASGILGVGRTEVKEGSGHKGTRSITKVFSFEVSFVYLRALGVKFFKLTHDLAARTASEIWDRTVNCTRPSRFIDSSQVFITRFYSRLYFTIQSTL